MTANSPSPLWWVISSEGLIAALREVQQGADPEMIYAELYANADHDDAD